MADEEFQIERAVMVSQGTWTLENNEELGETNPSLAVSLTCSGWPGSHFLDIQ